MPAGVRDAEPRAGAPSVHQRASCLQCLGQEAAVRLLMPQAATLPPAAPSQGLYCTVQMLAGEGVTGGDRYLATPGQILLSFLASAGKMAAYIQPGRQTFCGGPEADCLSQGQERLNGITPGCLSLCDLHHVGETPPPAGGAQHIPEAAGSPGLAAVPAQPSSLRVGLPFLWGSPNLHALGGFSPVIFQAGFAH